MERIQDIRRPDARAYQAAKNHWDGIAKPLGSYGALEEMIQKIAGIQGTPAVDISRRAAVIFCADHGVTEEGVTQCGQDVTAVCTDEIAEGRSNVNAVAAVCGAEVFAVDLGVAGELHSPKVIDRKIARGTQNFTRTAAMTPAETERALRAGMDMVRDLQAQGFRILVAGEMGIGNTTPAAAVASVLLGLLPEQVTGRGAGLSDAGLRRKIQAIRKGIALHQPDAAHPLHLLQTLGGLEIAGMAGLMLGGAYYRIPVILDGVISCAAAAVACGMEPLCREYLLASHCSGEPAAAGLLQKMGLRAVIDADLRLGEGTGGLLLLPLLDSALAMYAHAHSFASAQIERYTPQ